MDKGWFVFFITLLDQLYWVGSAGLGAALGTVLPFSTEGVDFVMTAMFTVIFLNQWEKDQQHGSALIGLAVPLVCLMVFGSGSFLLPSMGGILVRMYLKANKRDDIGRVVMLGPPNQGSEIVDALKDLTVFELLNGPAGLQLGTGPADVPKALGPVDFELGVIAGTQSINLLLSTLLPGDNDGKVSVESTKVERMKDFVALPTTHPLMMRNQAVIDQTLHFLRHGQFKELE